MGRTPRASMILPLALLWLPAASHAQGGGSDVYWHIDPGVRTCSMVIDPALTQPQWRTFTRQVGDIASFKPLASAEPLGRGRFALGVDYSSTPVDQHDPAWINTFTHPDVDCPLGDAIHVPTLRARVGVSDRIDAGASWTTAPGANYGLVAGELQYAFLEESARVPAAAIRGSITALTGVPDFNLAIYGVDVLASKRVAMFTPYLGVREGVAVGTETTSKVALHREVVPITQGFVGTACRVWMLRLAAEYDIADVNTLALVIGVHP